MYQDLCYIVSAFENEKYGNTQESKKVFLKFPFKCFCFLKGETVEETLTRFCHLTAEMENLMMEPSQSDQIDTVKNVLPISYSTFLLVLKENIFFQK